MQQLIAAAIAIRLENNDNVRIYSMIDSVW